MVINYSKYAAVAYTTQYECPLFKNENVVEQTAISDYESLTLNYI